MDERFIAEIDAYLPLEAVNVCTYRRRSLQLEPINGETSNTSPAE